ncbi:MAG TPA: hypothetical protein VJ802_01115 [Gemmatimonadaceae bacterium]|nr:hypothetical protein [Gemmatimonadaceae bacterium]
MLRLLPGASHLRLEMRPAGKEDHGVGRKQLGQRSPRRRIVGVVIGCRRVDRENDDMLDVARGPLGEDIELPERRDLIPPELEAHRAGHAEPIDVDNAATHRELRDIVDQRDALEADRLEV